MISGVGTDLCRIDRFDSWLKKPALCRRWFNPGELKHLDTLSSDEARMTYLAGRFAAREALGKALGTGLRGMILCEIEVAREDSGKPVFRFHGAMKGLGEDRRIHLSLSHDGGFVSAFAVIEQGGLHV